MSLTLYANPKTKISTLLTGGLLLDDDFIPLVDQMIEIGATHSVSFYFTSGFRMDSDHITGAIVEPAAMSNHFVGCAVDCNFLIHHRLYNTTLLRNDFPDGLKKAIEEIKAIGIRWGGDFRKKDIVHFDSGLNLSNPTLYQAKYNEYHPAAGV